MCGKSPYSSVPQTSGKRGGVTEVSFPMASLCPSSHPRTQHPAGRVVLLRGSGRTPRGRRGGAGSDEEGASAL